DVGHHDEPDRPARTGRPGRQASRPAGPAGRAGQAHRRGLCTGGLRACGPAHQRTDAPASDLGPLPADSGRSAAGAAGPARRGVTSAGSRGLTCSRWVAYCKRQPDSCMFGRQAMDDVFRALADPSRRLLLDSLNRRGGQSLRELCAGLDMARQSVSKHLAVLEAANLVTTVWRGREKLHYLNPAPINEISERWIDRYERGRVHALADLKRALEGPTMEKPSFVYTTYIQTTPER